MRVTPISGDMLIKLGLALATAGAVVYVLYRAKNAVADVVQGVVPLVNPADSRNLAYTGVNSVGAAITGEKDFSLGGWLYDITHPSAQPAIQKKSVSDPETWTPADPTTSSTWGA